MGLRGGILEDFLKEVVAFWSTLHFFRGYEWSQGFSTSRRGWRNETFLGKQVNDGLLGTEGRQVWQAGMKGILESGTKQGGDGSIFY